MSFNFKKRMYVFAQVSVFCSVVCNLMLFLKLFNQQIFMLLK